MGFGKSFKYISVVLILLISSISKAGVFSEIDILVREAAIAEVMHIYSEDELDHAFYELDYVISETAISGCHFVIDGKMEFPYTTYFFTVCVVAHSKADITASVIELIAK